MPSVNSKSFTQLVTDFATSVQARASALTDFSVGAVLRALAETASSVVVWLEGLILLLLATTRAATSSGADLDSWMADFSFIRLQAAYAGGSVTFARFTPTMQAVVPIGAAVQTTDGSQRYLVIVDTTNPAYNATLGGYLIPAGTASLAVPVLAVTSGAAGNVIAGAVSVLAQAVQYVDTVSNALPFTSGADAETDTAFRARFVTYIASLSRATKAAILSAVLSLKVGTSAALVENQDYNGTYRPGFFYAVVDDGTGNPGSTFLSSASNAIDAVRPFTVAYGVLKPTTIMANIVMTLAVSPGYDEPTTKAAVRAAILSYVGQLAQGQSLLYGKLGQIAFDTPGVANVTGTTTVNGGTSDIAVSIQQRILAGTVTVS